MREDGGLVGGDDGDLLLVGLIPAGLGVDQHLEDFGVGVTSGQDVVASADTLEKFSIQITLVAVVGDVGQVKIERGEGRKRGHLLDFRGGSFRG